MIRRATAQDWPAIVRCHQQLEQKLGKSMDLPELNNPAILGYWVVEEDGEIIGGFYREKCLEQCHFGTDHRATLAIRDFLPEVDALSQRAGVRFVHLDIPKELDNAADIGRHVEKSGYELSDDLVHYKRDLRGESDNYGQS